VLTPRVPPKVRVAGQAPGVEGDVAIRFGWVSLSLNPHPSKTKKCGTQQPPTRGILGVWYDG
jgi:hypothetical protein